ncbi:MAG: amidohydrolase family protein [Isosphaeraceae bacterium]
MIDVNVSIGHWPFRRLPLDDPTKLADMLIDHGVIEAWTGSFDALLHEDVSAINTRLAETCRAGHPGLLVPFGAVNPNLPDWVEDLRRCVEVHQMPGIRLHPNYHGYSLDDPECVKLLDLAAQRGLIVQIAVKMEDVRTQFPLLRVPDVNLDPLPGLIGRFPGLRIVLLNALNAVRGEPLKTLTGTNKVAVEIAMLEGICGVEHLIDEIGVSPILFGSLAPLFVFESALLKLKESPLTPEQRRAITLDNARRTLRPLLGD